ncbi:MAG: glycosyltransferase [Lachnospiraceae bacterium]|nr:glycosyltransferase [Lachnospiraceae bacterium]
MVTAIIPVYKPGKRFFKLLGALAKQSVCPKQVIVMLTEDSEYDLEEIKSGINDYFKKNPFISFTSDNEKLPYKLEIKRVAKSDFDHAGTRQKAALSAEGDYMLFLTQDVKLYNDEVISELQNCFRDEAVAVAYARQIANDNAKLAERFTRIYNYPSKSHTYSKKDIVRNGIRTYFCSDCCALYRRDYFFEIGGFADKIIFGEDTDFAARAIEEDYSIAYCATAKVYHSHNLDITTSCKRSFDIGVLHADLADKFEISKTTGTGKKYVLDTFHYLWGQHNFVDAIDFAMESVLKYINYGLGRIYKILPAVVIDKLTGNKNYWLK